MRLEEITTSTEKIFSGRIINLRVDTVLLPDGKQSQREIVEHQGAVAIVAIDQEENIILVKQFRQAVKKTLVEIPAGGIDPGESSIIAAQRELEEETGLIGGTWEEIFTYYSAPGFCDEKLVIFLAKELVPGKAKLDNDEFLEVITMPLTIAFEKVRNGEICDGKSIIGIQYAFQQRYGKNEKSLR